ncbi:hypothetical protein BBP40_010488, partial [Aspergillus hancockii]
VVLVEAEVAARAVVLGSRAMRHRGRGRRKTKPVERTIIVDSRGRRRWRVLVGWWD